VSALGAAKGAAGDRYWDEVYQKLINHTTVLLVEGEDDRLAMEAVLTARARLWKTHISVVELHGREALLTALRRNSLPPERSLAQFRVLGLVDRDVWTDADVAQRRADQANLHVTPGWCLESYHLLAAGEEIASLAAQRDRWVEAGALGWVQQRASEGWNRQKREPMWVPDVALDFTDEETLAESLRRERPNAEACLAKLSPGAVAEATLRRLAEVRALPAHEQWLKGIHGKEAFQRLYVPYQNRESGIQRDAKGWRMELAPSLAALPEIDALVQELLS
jgi:hypothetical protein